ncbi:substrate-binding domain-containing protein [Kiloniella laminariae]|uniref:substrate-binding domain-containing protein n=1 Tax=Kiloniella laminariae TaxID=454162 RepID=UPI00035DF2E0|nr:substrate-binding domain-containing protein [Kiloniella laminariae]
MPKPRTTRSLLATSLFIGLFSSASAGPLQDVDLTKAPVGPNGNPAVSASEITLSPDEIAQLKTQNYKAALVWHASGDWVNAVTAGAKSKFEELGIEVVATTDAQFDSARQASDVENVLALTPDIILTLVVDPVSGAATFQPAIDKGTKLVLLSNPISGYQANDQYTGIVTDDMYGMGSAAAEMMSDALGGKGSIGFIYHDADYFITNNRDNAFRSAIKEKHSGLEIVAEKGFTEEGQTFELTSAMVLQNPDISGIYVAWDVAAEGVIGALRAQGRQDIKVITHDLGQNNALDMIKGGSMYGTIADRPFEIGQAMASLGAYGLLGKESPAFSVVGFDKVVKENIAKTWEKSLHRPLPAKLEEALN